ncbi:MAG: hypothetical protein ACR2PL_03960, partial [Dehalococcoidia bacterium]
VMRGSPSGARWDQAHIDRFDAGKPPKTVGHTLLQSVCDAWNTRMDYTRAAVESGIGQVGEPG